MIIGRDLRYEMYVDDKLRFAAVFLSDLDPLIADVKSRGMVVKVIDRLNGMTVLPIACDTAKCANA